ncbi:MAG: bifunctional rhamnulose-1-phosphate aldolase/short-chain dehydrogenase [Deltaproteobacteria bacterium]|nr:bifunctional rhamnulose-1-phosphate aldolase/short-chain dehydrogenase [Deltaproteobacteria bacterium]
MSQESKRPYPKWDDAYAAKLDPVQKLVYRSNLLGSDQRITNTGGGNTSAKLIEKDPITNEDVEVLWVKGSGGDLRTSKKDGFASLYQKRLIGLQELYARFPNRGAKTEAEDKMVDMYKHSTFNLNPRAASIDTPLHSFVPRKQVDHMHPNSVISIAACKDREKLTQEVFGGELDYMNWLRPGFELGLELQEICKKNPKAKGAIMGQHGVINWADDDKTCYELTIDLIEKADAYIAKCDKGEKTFGGKKFETLPESKRHAVLAEVLPFIRGQITFKGQRLIGTIQDDETMMRYVNSVDAPRLADVGTSCPDHFLRTKIKPLYVNWDPSKEDVAALKTKLTAGLEAYRQGYKAYYERCKRPDSPAMRNPNPSVVLIPGCGMIAWGKTKSESRVTAEFYNCAVEVMRGAEAISEYVALPEQEAFDIEYWALEEAKLRRMPAEEELSRQVVAVIGAGNGIGKQVAIRLMKEGATVACIDRDLEAARATAKELEGVYGVGIGVAGTGISGSGPVVGLAADITSRESVRAALQQIVLAYGGIDTVVVTAGIFVPPDKTGHIGDDKWGLTYDINVIGPYLVADEATAIWKAQGTPGNFVMTTSVNAAVAKKGSVAYDTSKAAANHLVRELAVELAPLVRVNAVAPATVVKGSTMFPRDRVISSLAKYNIAHDESESTEALRDKLAQFYADRTLLKQPITPEDQAEAVFLLVSNRLPRTTGQVINVDGGLTDAFLR